MAGKTELKELLNDGYTRNMKLAQSDEHLQAHLSAMANLPIWNTAQQHTVTQQPRQSAIAQQPIMDVNTTQEHEATTNLTQSLATGAHAMEQLDPAQQPPAVKQSSMQQSPGLQLPLAFNDHASTIASLHGPAVDGPVDEETIMSNKIVNEEYKIWKKNAVYLYDFMYTKALDWPTLTTQWFRDKQSPPGENCSVHRLLIGTHTSNDTPNYLQIAQFTVPTFFTNAEDYDAEREEIGSGYNPAKKSQPAPNFKVVQKIDHDGEVNKARYMPQRQDLIATMGVNGKVMLFDRTKHPSEPTGKVNPQMELVGHTKEGYGLNWHPKREGELVTGSEDCTVKLWNVKDYESDGKKIKATRTFTHHSAVVNDVKFNPHIEKAVATVSDDMTLQIIDTLEASTSRAAFKTDNAHSDAINSVSWNPEIEFLLATGSADKTIGLWDLRNLSIKLHSCENHRDVVSQVEWHPTEKSVVASSSYDRRICFWDLNLCGNEQTPEDAEDGPPELLFMHGGHTNRISDFSFNLNDPWLMCSAAEDNLISIWKTAKSIIGRDVADVPLQEVEH